MFDETKINILREAGLLVSPISEGPYKGGYSIAKPEKVQGNNRTGYQGYYGPEQILTDAPCSRLLIENRKLLFSVREYVPGPGPGDFQEEFEDIELCLKSILDYYFGDPTRMNPREYLETRKRP
ncbi:hypothetical protein [Synechococcus sp. PCC 7336]|uniref:hypothetical protein n=1 Tax=Synechococcus sp. PCC 7336 TaxID=195250 RepID=UPI0012EAA8C4|nr:hypothetical protein [Synechococcus sp. PCC 7336]